MRRFRDDDLDALARWHADPLFMRHMGRGPMSRPESASALARYAEHWDEHGFGILAVEHRETGTLVGRSGVAYHRAWRPNPEVGWAIEPTWWGRGLATEAGAACVRWGHDELGFDRLVSICLAENAASRRVMEKLGFELLTTVEDPFAGLDLLVHARDT